MRNRLGVWMLCMILFPAFINVARSAELGGDFDLIDQEGRPFQLQQLRGKVVLLFFGYTSCPDVCPTEFARISRVSKLLKKDASRIQAVFVSVDPERDKPQVLKEYVRYFDRSIIGLTGSASDIEKVTRQYQVTYGKYVDPDGDYSMDHTANLYVIGTDGKLFAIIPYGFPAEHVVDMVKEMLTIGA